MSTPNPRFGPPPPPPRPTEAADGGPVVVLEPEPKPVDSDPRQPPDTVPQIMNDPLEEDHETESVDTVP